MSEESNQPPQEEPRERFRRLLTETEEDLDQSAAESETNSEAYLEETSNALRPSTQKGGQEEQGDEDHVANGSEPSGSQPTETLILPVDEDGPDSITPQGKADKTEPALDEGDTVPVHATRPATGLNDGQTRPTVVSGETPQKKLPALDSFGFPLPRRVNETDVDATRVTPTAYAPQVRHSQQSGAGGRKPPTHHSNRYSRNPAPASRRKDGYQRSLGCLLRSSIIGLFALAFLALIGISFLIFQYYRIAKTLPDIRDLRQRASQFETTRILDRNGNVLYEILDPNAGRRTYVPLDKISPYLVAATVATEDKGFYSHPGVDLFAIARAFWQNYQSGSTVSGASTITQQLARTLLFTPEERNERTYQRKIREAILATEITRRYSKDEILELYFK